VAVIGAGLAGSEAAWQLAERGVKVRLYEMRPAVQTPVHETGLCAELVCSNSLKSLNPNSAAGCLKAELASLGSLVLCIAFKTQVPAGTALAVDRIAFAEQVTATLQAHPNIEFINREVRRLEDGKQDGCTHAIVATGPLTTDALSASTASEIGEEFLAF